MRARMIVVSVAAVLAMAPAALATPIPDGITRSEVTTYLKSKGFPVSAAKDSNGLSILKSTAAGVNFDVYFFDCNAAERCQSIQFAAGWTLPNPVDRQKLNKWNEDHRFLRAYVQDGGALYGELDIVLAPNGSTDILEKYRKLWEVLIGKFKAEFGL